MTPKNRSYIFLRCSFLFVYVLVMICLELSFPGFNSSLPRKDDNIKILRYFHMCLKSKKEGELDEKNCKF